MFSQDQDILGSAADWQRVTRSFGGLIFAQQEGLSIGRCIDDLALIAECSTAEELASQVLFVPL